MASIRSPRQYTDCADWTRVTVPASSYTPTYDEDGQARSFHDRWLDGDLAEGRHVMTEADRDTISYAFSNPNTAMAFKLRFG